MRKINAGLIVFGLLFFSTTLFAADGDLIVNGKVGVGTTSTSGAKLTIKAESATAPALTIRDSSDTPAVEFRSSAANLRNTFIGLNSGVANTTGSFNTANGTYTLRSNTTGNYNTANGFQALYYNTTGNSNTANGTYAGTYISNGSTGNSTSNNSVYLGAQTRALAVGDTNEIVIGYNAIGNGSNSVTLGNDSITKTILKGNVGIGATDTGSYKLYVAGNAYTTGIWGSSDIRWKKNIEPIGNALSLIQGLQGVNFDWRTDEFKDKNFEEGRQVGLIAQDVEKVIPEIVKTDNRGYKAVSYEKLTAVLVEAVKEQQKTIEALKAENGSLIRRLTSLEEKVK